MTTRRRFLPKPILAKLAELAKPWLRLYRWLETWSPLGRIDRLSTRWAVFLGLLLAVGCTAALFLMPSNLDTWIMAAAVVLGVGLVVTSRPVGVWDPPPESGESLLDMVPVRGGGFVMGSPFWERGRYGDETQHRVRLSPFRMTRTEVTGEQYRIVMGDSPSPWSDQHPVTAVTWFDAVMFCNRLSEMEGLPPCYSIDGEEVHWIADLGGYRLPTEAEWEYVARAGSNGRWPFSAKKLEEHAWFGINAGGQAHPVATREANPWGFHDLNGNVWEWCWDVYGPYGWGYARDPRAPHENRLFNSEDNSKLDDETIRVFRGDSFDGRAIGLRSAYRGKGNPSLRLGRIGFRCARRPNSSA